MVIKYSLQKNHLTSAPNDYIAYVLATSTDGIEQVIERMIEQGSTVSRSDILAALEDFFSAIESIVLEGRNANTPIANFGTSIKGVFNGQDDSFDPHHHRLCARVSPGARLRRTISERGLTQKAESIKPKPNPLELRDINSGERNNLITPGGMAQLNGHRLKFDGEKQDQGVFFIAGDGSETKVAVVGQNKPSQLAFLIPDTLVPGEYTLEVRAVLRNTQGLRRGSLGDFLRVDG